MNNLSYISPKAAVAESTIHGRGLFAVEPIGAGEIVCVKGGHVFDREALRSMPGWYRAAEIQIAATAPLGLLADTAQAHRAGSGSLPDVSGRDPRARGGNRASRRPTPPGVFWPRRHRG